MKAKILFALTALLMLGSVSLNAQENGNSSNGRNGVRHLCAPLQT